MSDGRGFRPAARTGLPLDKTACDISTPPTSSVGARRSGTSRRIEKAQKQSRERGQPNRIEKIDKSQQRLEDELIRIHNLEDAEDWDRDADEAKLFADALARRDTGDESGAIAILGNWAQGNQTKAPSFACWLVLSLG